MAVGGTVSPHVAQKAHAVHNPRSAVLVTERWHSWNGLRYRVWERPAPGSATPPLVLIHGYAACVEQWGRFIRDIGPDVPVYAVDLIGFGEASKPRYARYGRDLYLAQLEHLRAAYGWRQVIAVGHSLGGMLAIEWAGHRPEAVAALIALAPGGFLDGEGLGSREQAVLRFLSKPALTRLVFGFITHLPYRVLSAPAYVDRATIDPVTEAAIKRAMHAPGAVWSYSAVLRHHDAFFTAARHETVRCPMHILWGTRDVQVPEAEIAALCRDFPRASVSRLPNGGHCIHEESARVVTAEVRSLLVHDGLLAPVPAPLMAAD